MALAAVLDPVTKDAAVVFHYSQKKPSYNLAVNLYSLAGAADSPFKDRNTSHSLVSPSSPLAAANFQGATRVFGVANIPKVIETNKKTGDEAEGNADVVTQLSPVFNPVDEPSEINVQVPPQVPLAVTETNKNKVTTGFLSYISEIDKTKKIITYTINKNGTKPNIISPSLHEYSKLAACSLNNKPYLFFQDADKKLVYRVDGDTTTVKGTGGMAEGSHIAVAVVGGLFYIYFRTGENKLNRVVGIGEKWSNAEDVPDNSDVNTDSYIALVPYTTASNEPVIHHFYLSGEDIIHGNSEAEVESF